MAEAGERYAECTFVETDRFGGGSFMVLGGICLRGRMELHIMAAGTLTAVRYPDEILDPIVRPFAGAIANNFILMQDNSASTDNPEPHIECAKEISQVC